MVTFPLPVDTFPMLELEEHDKHKLEAAAEMIIKKNIELYLEHLAVHRGVVDETRWKKIKRREDVRVYRDRTPVILPAGDVAAKSNMSGSASNVRLDSESFKNLTTLLVFGSIPGDLDDVMYGVLDVTTEDMQLKTAYIEDGFADWAVLASMITPSEVDPFRNLSIKWTMKKNPLLVGTVIRNRDAVYIESTGIALTQNGERIGYHLYHSVDIPEIRELTDEYHIVRGRISVCEFFRQRDKKCVEVYSRFVLNPMGDALPSLIGISISEIAVSVFKHVHCAQMKKLTRIVSAETAARATTSQQGQNQPSTATPKMCALCLQSIGGGLSFASSTPKRCRICTARVCSRCRIHKSVFLPSQREKKLRRTNMVFCTRCVINSAAASSLKFASLDAAAKKGKDVRYLDTLRF